MVGCYGTDTAVLEADVVRAATRNGREEKSALINCYGWSPYACRSRKYKGRLIADIPGHYLNWMAREGFPKGELGDLLALMREIDHNGLSPLLDPLRSGANEGKATSPRRSKDNAPTTSASATPKIR